jgi:hypothetical protein
VTYHLHLASGSTTRTKNSSNRRSRRSCQERRTAWGGMHVLVTARLASEAEFAGRACRQSLPRPRRSHRTVQRRVIGSRSTSPCCSSVRSSRPGGAPVDPAVPRHDRGGRRTGRHGLQQRDRPVNPTHSRQRRHESQVERLRTQARGNTTRASWTGSASSLHDPGIALRSGASAPVRGR